MVAAGWHDAVRAHRDWLNCTYEALEDWEKSGADYYPTNLAYMDELLANDVPTLEISWTTRFNAFVVRSVRFQRAGRS